MTSAQLYAQLITLNYKNDGGKLVNLPYREGLEWWVLMLQVMTDIAGSADNHPHELPSYISVVVGEMDSLMPIKLSEYHYLTHSQHFKY